MVSARVRSEDPQTGSLWRHGGRKRMGVVRVEGMQAGMFGSVPTVLVADGIRGAMPLRFGTRRPVAVECFRRRYRAICDADATVWARGNKRKSGRGGQSIMDKEASVADGRQAVLGDGAVVGAPTTPGGNCVAWAFDAVVLNAGVGGASHGLALAGLRVVGVDADPEAARAHSANVSHCAIAEPLGWKPPPGARARVVFYALPTSFPREEMPEERQAKIPGEDDGVSAADRAKIIASWPRRRRFGDAFRLAVELGAEALIVEVCGGRRGKDEDYEVIRDMATAGGFRAFVTQVDASFLGLPQVRPTRIVVALRVGPQAAPPRWPKPTHAPTGNTGDLAPFQSMRSALGLQGPFLHAGSDAVVKTGVLRVNVEAPSPTIGPKGLVEKLVAEGADGTAMAPRSFSPDEVRALQGLPDSFTFGGVRPTDAKKLTAWERDTMRHVATAFPPVLARGIAKSVLQCLDAAREESVVHEESAGLTA